MKKNERGEVAALLTIAVLLVVGATTFISSLVLKTKKTVTTKASGAVECVPDDQTLYVWGASDICYIDNGGTYTPCVHTAQSRAACCLAKPMSSRLCCGAGSIVNEESIFDYLSEEQCTTMVDGLKNIYGGVCSYDCGGAGGSLVPTEPPNPPTATTQPGKPTSTPKLDPFFNEENKTTCGDFNNDKINISGLCYNEAKKFSPATIFYVDYESYRYARPGQTPTTATSVLYDIKKKTFNNTFKNFIINTCCSSRSDKCNNKTKRNICTNNLENSYFYYSETEQYYIDPNDGLCYQVDDLDQYCNENIPSSTPVPKGPSPSPKPSATPTPTMKIVKITSKPQVEPKDTGTGLTEAVLAHLKTVATMFNNLGSLGTYNRNDNACRLLLNASAYCKSGSKGPKDYQLIAKDQYICHSYQDQPPVIGYKHNYYCFVNPSEATSAQKYYLNSLSLISQLSGSRDDNICKLIFSDSGAVCRNANSCPTGTSPIGASGIYGCRGSEVCCVSQLIRDNFDAFVANVEPPPPPSLAELIATEGGYVDCREMKEKGSIVDGNYVCNEKEFYSNTCSDNTYIRDICVTTVFNEEREYFCCAQ